MDTDRLLRELTDFLRIPSVSTSASHNADCRAAAEWVAGELRRLGCREVRFLASDTHPVVWGVGPDVPGAPTLLIYGHYDVQPPSRSTNGPRPRSSRRCATASCSRAAPRTTKGKCSAYSRRSRRRAAGAGSP